MPKTESQTVRRVVVSLDVLVAVVLFILSLVIYLRTLAPSVAFLFDDSLEFQLLASRLAIAHPTGYPLYSILLKLFTFVPLGDIAYRANLASACFGALAVAFVYLAARRLTDRFMTANDRWGQVLVRVPAFVAALGFAFGETFWSQAVIAEVYALQALLTAAMLWLVLRWSDTATGREGEGKPSTPLASLTLIAFFAGLMLTHHRLTVLLFPALAVYVLSYDRTFWRSRGTLWKLALAFLLPLLLYLYLPVRGAVTTSLNGLYANTPTAFLDWVMGTSYSVFLSQNPFNQQRDALYYWNLFFNEFTPFGILLALEGLVALWLRAWREGVLLALGLAANLAFGLSYRVADINVFFIPAFVIVALLLGVGIAGLIWVAFYGLPNRAAQLASIVGLLLMLILPLSLAGDHYGRVDLSNKWDVHDYGRDVLAQAFPPNATLIGILGEMTLARYFQETQELQPELETLAADKEDARLVTVGTALNNHRTVFLTRPLNGAEKKYSLDSFGPLVRVSDKPNRTNAPAPAHPLDADFGGVKLLGYDVDGALTSDAGTWHDANGRRARVTLYWQVEQKPKNDRLISLKLLDANGRLGGQLDRRPVLDAYPTTAWRKGEYITDTYDVPIFTGALPGEYALQVTMYDPETGEVDGQRELEKMMVPPETDEVYPALVGVEQTPLHDFGDVELIGYSLDTTNTYDPGAQIPTTFVWRILQQGAGLDYEIAVQNASGVVVQTQAGTIEANSYAAGQYLRQELGVGLPDNLKAGSYTVRVVARGRTAALLTSNTVSLGTLEVVVPEN